MIFITKVLLYASLICSSLWCLTFSRKSKQKYELILTMSSFFCIGSLFIILLIAHYEVSSWFYYSFHSSHPEDPWFYKVASIWSTHEGSMMLWCFLWAAVMLFFAYETYYLMQSRLALKFLGITFLFFLLYLLMNANPFIPLSYTQSQGLNPLLYNRYLMIHPPFLYMGYIVSAVPWALSLSVLYHKTIAKESAVLLIRWTIISWIFLTIGIALGAHWAYQEEGWGGWWSWDPIENISLVIWLALTLLFHRMGKGMMTRSTFLLGMLPFCLVLVGIFLARSGLIQSVHSFVGDSGISLMFLIPLCLFLGSGLFYAYRFFTKNKKITPSIILIRYQSYIFLFCITIMMFIMFFPLISPLFSLTSVDIQPIVHSHLFYPIVCVLMIIIGLTISPISFDVSQHLKIFVFITLLLILLRYILSYDVFRILSFYLSIIIIFCLLTGISYRHLKQQKVTRKFFILCIGHIGLLVSILGGICDSIFSEKTSFDLQENKSIDIRGIHIKMDKIEFYSDAQRKVAQATFIIEDRGQQTIVQPTHIYWKKNKFLTKKPVLYRYYLTDLFVSLGHAYQNNMWIVEFSIHPFLNLMWLGLLLMIISMILYLQFYVRLK